MNGTRDTPTARAGDSGRSRVRGGWKAAGVALAAIWGAASGGCDRGDAPPEGACGEFACDVPQTRAELLAELSGIGDPMAAALRQLADDDATVGGGWPAVLDALGSAVDCAADSERSFVVLSNQALRPKGIVTRCVDRPIDASRFFMIFEPDAVNDDLEGEAFRVAAWDEDAAQYRRYQMVPGSEGRLRVSVEPEFCAGCHGGLAERHAWIPIMNEMTEPWAQWNAEPEFTSFAFDEAFPEHTRGEVFEAVADPTRLDSAANLEPIVRAALSRVSLSRVAARQDAANLDVALDLLRPVFCDETVNFASEIHQSGEINLDAVLDPGLRDAFVALDVGAWPWQTDLNLRIDPPAPGESALALVAIRGHAVVGAEQALRSRGVLTAHQILRVRALDWTHPFSSPLRCTLFTDAEQRARTGQGPVDAGAHPDNAALVVALYEDAMQIDGVALAPASEASVIAIADAGDLAALPADAVSTLDTELTVLGEQVAAHVASFATAAGRAALTAERNRRGCIAAASYPVTPIIPELPACA